MHRPAGVLLCLEAMCTSVDQGTSTKITRYLLTVYQTRSSLNICRQMALFEMVQTLILRFANMEKWINSLNLSTLIFRTLQYLKKKFNIPKRIGKRKEKVLYLEMGTPVPANQKKQKKICIWHPRSTNVMLGSNPTLRTNTINNIRKHNKAGLFIEV